MSFNYDALLLASGGMDSTVMYYWLKNKNLKILPVFIDYGQHFKETEYQSLINLLPSNAVSSIRIIRIGDIFQNSKSRLIIEPNLWEDDVTSDDLYLPYRNLLFLTLGASIAQAEKIPEVYAAFINSNHAKEIDGSKEFLDNLTTMLAGFGQVTVQLPFRDFTKKEVANLGIELGVPISRTYSCQANSNTHCGVCPNCVDRIEALNIL